MPELFLPHKTVVVLNPVSGSQSTRRKAKAMTTVLREQGFRIAATTGPDQAGRLAREAVESGCDSVIACGGDGTLYETIADLPPEVGIGFFPMGTVNLFARGLNIPQEPDAWRNLLAARTTVPMYFGRCNGRLFACVASIGFDATVVAQVNRSLKKWIQKGAYVVEALRAFPNYYPPHYRITMDGRLYTPPVWMGQPMGIIVGRVPYYGGLHPILPKADPRKARLEVALLHAHNRWSILMFAWGVLVGSLPKMRGVEYRTVRTLRVECEPASWIQLDGDAFGQTPVDMEVEAVARQVLAPASLPI